MNLFEMNEGMLVVSPEALTIQVFKKIWTRDKKKSKQTAFNEFSFIYFFCDYKSDFADIMDEEEREKAIVESVIGPNSKWKPDAIVKQAMDFYIERSSTVTSVMLDDAKSAISKLSKFLRNINLEERDEKNRLIHNPKTIAGMIGEMSSIAENASKLEQKVKKELEEENNIRGNRKKNIFEDGI
jgi:hypothetical protein